jgi:hypothetical protein
LTDPRIFSQGKEMYKRHSESFNGLATRDTACSSSAEQPVALMVVGTLSLQQRTKGGLDACLEVCDMKLAEVTQSSGMGSSAHTKLNKVI